LGRGEVIGTPMNKYIVLAQYSMKRHRLLHVQVEAMILPYQRNCENHISCPSLYIAIQLPLTLATVQFL
jgi:hypothetical protein